MNELTCIQKNACPRTRSVLYSAYRSERREHDGSRASSIPQRARLASFQAQTREERVLLCSEMASWLCLYRASRQARRNHRRASPGFSSQGSLKNKATNWWQTTINEFVALGLMVQACKTLTIAPRICYPFAVSIATLTKKSQWLYKSFMGSTRKEVYP
jgi:hypothetical protein